MRQRTNPAPWHSGFLLHRGLNAQLHLHTRNLGHVDVLDVGCGTQPYRHLFDARSYTGIDLAPGPSVDVVGHAENLPLPDDSFDVVLCTQVLEHSDNPSAVVSEARRVLRPGGTALISTHGAIRHHGTATVGDHWRWTHTGLQRLFNDWNNVNVYPNGGSWAAIAFLSARELEISLHALHTSQLAKPAVLALNVLAHNADRATRHASSGPPGIAANYLVVAS